MAEYIERDKMLAKFIEGDGDDEFTEGYNFAVNEHRDKLKAIPAADVQPIKQGRWKSSQRTIETGTVYCSNCAIEYYISDLQTVGDYSGIVHYCPNCGALMTE